MEIILYTVISFVLMGFACTFICVVFKMDLSDLIPVFKPKTLVRPVYWGEYSDCERRSIEAESFPTPEISQHES